MTSVLHPNQFKVNEAWIVFRLNDTPIHTDQDGSFNCICVMDAASCYLLNAELIPASEGEPSPKQVHNILSTAWEKNEHYPKTVFIPAREFPNALKSEAERLGITVISVPEDQLLLFIGEAREGYKENMGRTGNG